MHTWIWPRKIALCGVVVVSLIGLVWPCRVSQTEIIFCLGLMTGQWGQPLSMLLMKTTLGSLRVGVHLTGLNEWIGTQDLLPPSSFRFHFTLRLCALAIWLGWMVMILLLHQFFLRCISGHHQKRIRTDTQKQPWNQEQRWPLWRRSMGLIPLMSFFWCCGLFGGMGLAPLFAGVWALMAFILWWP